MITRINSTISWMETSKKSNFSWHDEFDSELATAEEARRRGNEGMARVCARRAAGVVAKEFLRRRNIPAHSSSVYERIKMLRSIQGLPERSREAAGYFLMRITPGHELPIQVDLLEEARWLKKNLLEVEKSV
jgi:hypothetical protein